MDLLLCAQGDDWVHARGAARRQPRREEGYGDLVGLAWSAQRHPRDYARLHAWLVAERSRDLVPGSPHDTLAWVRLAARPSAVADPSMFAGPALLWLAGLAAAD